MKRIALVGFALGALTVAAPSMAQDYKQPVVERDTVPVQISQQHIKDVQRTLNEKGFSAGRVDGLWGKDTEAALKRFQSKNNLNPTGELDRTTELDLGLIRPGNRMATPAATIPAATPPAATPPVATLAPAPVLPTTVPATASTATPPAVVVAPVVPSAAPPATSSTTASQKQPKATAGANSFTEGQARDRIQGDGYQDVRNLALDSSGVWRGTATKNGQPVSVWLDYQGDVGQR